VDETPDCAARDAGKRRPADERSGSAKEIGAIDEQARFVTDYWSRRTIAGLLLLPATRHNFVHLNEAANQVGKD
jgi:hypothetical protein